MSSSWEKELQSAGKAEEAGHSLPREYYTSGELFELECRQIIFKSWLCVGHVSLVAEPNSYITYEVAGESVIVIRGADGKIRALLNVCSHRGSRLCTAPRGKASGFVCPYHAWRYDQDGRLTNARKMPDNLDFDTLSLTRLQVRVIEGIIHICFAKEPLNIGSVEQDMKQYFALNRIERAKIAHTETVVVRANWKLVVENFWECYHCAPTHPELSHVMDYVRANESTRKQDGVESYREEWRRLADALGYPAGSVKREDGVCQAAGRQPINRGFKTQSQNGEPVAPLMGDFTEYDGGSAAIQFYPFNWYVANNDYAMIVRFTPVSADDTEVEVTWLVNGSAIEGSDYEVEKIVWLWKNTLEQDKQIVENNQKGVNSRFYSPGPHSTMEKLGEFYKWYFSQMNGTGDGK